MKLKRLFATVLICALASASVFAMSSSAINVFTNQTETTVSGERRFTVRTNAAGTVNGAVRVGNANLYVDEYRGNDANWIEKILIQPRSTAVTGTVSYAGNNKQAGILAETSAGAYDYKWTSGTARTVIANITLTGTITSRWHDACISYSATGFPATRTIAYLDVVNY